MPQSCTILAPADVPHRSLDVVRDLVASRGRVEVSGDGGNWSAITVRGSQGSPTLTFTRRIFVRRGDEFSKMRLGMWAYFDRVSAQRPGVKEVVLKRIDEYALAIGVVAEPEFVEDAGHFDCIFGLTRALDGIIWNGSGVLDAEGSLLLDGEGKSDIEG